MLTRLLGRPGVGLSLCLSALLLAMSGASATACPAGAKCVSLASDGRLASIQPPASGPRFISAPEPYIPAVAFEPVPPVTVAPIVEVGDRLERGRYNLLIGSEYHALPPPPDGALYYEVDEKVLVVDHRTMEVIGDVTHKAKRIY